MRALVSALFLLLGPAGLIAEGRSELDILRARCAEQERQIRTLEKEIEDLHGQLALERRRSRGVEPSAAAASSVAPSPAADYTVKTGDTLSLIARRYRTSAAALMKENGIEDPTRLRVGQKLALPADSQLPKAVVAEAAAPAPSQDEVAAKPAPSQKSTDSEPPTSGNNEYTVQRGDTLYGIARRHKMKISSLRALNPKLEDKIIVGQTILVAGEPRQPRRASIGTSQTQTIAIKETAPAPDKPSPTKRKVTEAPKSQPAAPTPAEAPKKKSSEEEQEEQKPEPAPETADSQDAAEVTVETPSLPPTLSSIIVMEEVSFGDFARKHGTTSEELNTLNGWSFQPDLVLARGSEIYVPTR